MLSLRPGSSFLGSFFGTRLRLSRRSPSSVFFVYRRSVSFFFSSACLLVNSCLYVQHGVLGAEHTCIILRNIGYITSMYRQGRNVQNFILPDGTRPNDHITILDR
jgi:hypothetical protein